MIGDIQHAVFVALGRRLGWHASWFDTKQASPKGTRVVHCLGLVELIPYQGHDMNDSLEC